MSLGRVVSLPIAAMPMYDLPELREAHDRLWAALARRLEDAGVTPVPRQLTRSLSHRATWMHPGLLFGQACEYPVSKSFRERLRIIATPRYYAPGCFGSSYRSAIVVRAQASAKCLEDLRDCLCVANEPDSNSGMNLFRAAVAPLADGAPFFRSVDFSGSHRKSLEVVAAGDADVTAVDCVTLAHLQRHQPQLVSQLRVLDWTPASPCLPFVTSRHTSDDMLEALRTAIAEVVVDRDLASTRESLFLEGVDLSPDVSLGRVNELEQQAERLRYPQLQ
jgi:ABC-type phosphate/phosphonate transport system substrate-binding protein